MSGGRTSLLPGHGGGEREAGKRLEDESVAKAACKVGGKRVGSRST